MSYADKDLPDLIENIKRLEVECESWRKEFRNCAIELASAEAENAKLWAVAEAAKAVVRTWEGLDSFSKTESLARHELSKALSTMETANG